MTRKPPTLQNAPRPDSQEDASDPVSLQEENKALAEEVRRLTRLAEQQRFALNKAMAQCTEPQTQQWTRKRKFYTAMIRIGMLTGGRFAERMRQKEAKYHDLLNGAKTAHSQVPAPFSSYDELLLAKGNDRAVTAAASEEPTASIVIPVYNQIEFTRACLRSLARLDTEHPFEVIVVDDCSTDATETELARLGWIRYIRRQSNGGFIESCNSGLAAARGRYVAFLNNDTEVLAGWLDELIRTFADFPNAGLVGSKLIYPDGRLQEAGAILWNDGRAANYGREDDPYKPQYCYARKVDYCSGASMMAPRALLNELGGFDRHFAPAYCEDADLAMRVRQTGSDVIIQPLSIVVHYEGVSSGTDESQGVKAYQVVNRKKLYERWREALACRPNPGSGADEAKDFGVSKRLLVIDWKTPEPDQDAGSVTCTEIMRAAQALGYQTTFIAEDQLADVPKYTADIQRVGIEALYRPYCESISDHLKRHGRRYDAILVYRVKTLSRSFGAIKKWAPQARLVYQTSDLHHLRESRQAELLRDPQLAARAKKTKAAELELVRKCDCTVVHSLYEKMYLGELVPEAKIEVFNWILDPVGTDVGFEKRSGMMFLGGYSHDPNVDAVHYFLDEIWPLVEPRLPGAKFRVVGSQLPDELVNRASDRVEMVGFVEDLKPTMDSCRLSVVPLRYGAGTKGKLAMSFAYGLPAVSTSIGAEGMGLLDGEATFIADDPAAFADRVVELYEDPMAWERMSRQAIDYVAENLSRAHGTEVIRRALIGD